MTYFDLLERQAERHPQHLCLVVEERSWSYAEMVAAVSSCAARIREVMPSSWERGSVLVLGETFFWQITAFLALQALGIRPVLLHHGLREEERTAILQENELQGLLTIGEAEMCCEETQLPSVPHAEDILGVLSSGSTGTPKVMYRTYKSWAGFFPVQNPIFGIDGDTRLFLHGSLSFTGNMNAALSVWFAGGTVCTSEQFRCRHWAAQMRRDHVNVLYLIPSKLQLLTAAVRAPLPEVRCLFTGSQLLSAQDIRDLKTLLPQAELILYYGASELNYITYARCDDPDRDIHNLGRPFPGVGITTKDGLIYVDTEYHVSGIEIPFTVKDTGWLNAKGELIFEGRRDAWINKGGVKLSTLRLQNELQDIPGIRQAVLLPYEERRRGTELAAFLVRGGEASEQSLRRSIRKHLRPVEIPRKIFFVDAIPLNDRGKPDRVLLRSRLAAEFFRPLASELSKLRGERYQGCVIGRAEWAMLDGAEKEDGCHILCDCHNLMRVECRHGIQRLRVTLLFRKEGTRTHTATVAPPSASSAPLVFTEKDIEKFIQAVGDTNRIHRMAHPIVPGLLIMEAVLRHFPAAGSLCLRFHQPALAGSLQYDRKTGNLTQDGCLVAQASWK